MQSLNHRSNFPYLLDAYNDTLQQHRQPQTHLFSRISSESDHSRDKDYDVCQQRKKIILELKYTAPTIAYTNFLKALYPLKLESSLHLGQHKLSSRPAVIENMQKYQNINHDLVYQQFCSLPSPAFLHMEPQHAEEFLAKFLIRRDFTKPSVLSSSANLGPVATLKAYQSMIEQRTEYVNMCSHVFEDLRDSGLPISKTERNKLFYYLYHKDRHDVLGMVDRAISMCEPSYEVPKLSSRVFDWNAYQAYKKQFDTDERSTNMLLSLALRHRQPDIAKDILDQGVNNTETVNLVLDAQLDRFWSKHITHAFEMAFKYCSESCLDISTVNKLINVLVHRGEVHLAEKLVSAFAPESSLASEKSLIVYKQVTAEDAQLYDKVLQKYDTASSGQMQYKLFPTEDTFLPLIEHYTRNRLFDSALNLMNVMELGYGLPLSTRVFHHAVRYFKYVSTEQEIEQSAEQFRYLLARLIVCHSYSYRAVDDTTYGTLNEMTIPPALELFLSPFMNTSAPALPYERGTFLKLRDDLVNDIFFAAIRLIKDDSMAHLISQRQNSLREIVSDLRKLPKLPMQSAMVHMNDAVIYAKREALLDLMELILA